MTNEVEQVFGIQRRGFANMRDIVRTAQFATSEYPISAKVTGKECITVIGFG
jgi:hypothetical protein